MKALVQPGSRYVEGDQVVYRASGLGGCPRALAAWASGFEPAPPPAVMQNAFDEGTALEDRILEVAGVSDGTTDRQREIDLSVGRVGGKPVIVRAHIDGRYTGTLIPMLVELKKFRDSNWVQWKKYGLDAFPRYQWQISAEMHELGEECMFIVGHAVDGEITEVDTRVIGEPPISLIQIREKITMIEHSISGTGVDLKCDPIQYPCPWFFLHDGDAVESRERVNDVAMSSHAQAIARDMATVTRLEKEIKREKDELKRLMVSNGYEGGKITVDGWQINHVVAWIPERQSTTKAYAKDYVTVMKEKA